MFGSGRVCAERVLGLVPFGALYVEKYKKVMPN